MNYSKRKVIVRMMGGLGNQLFCYATARRLALVNSAELVIDCETGFIRDQKYCRHYELDSFNLPARKATYLELMNPLERYRRALKKWHSRIRPFSERNYLEQEGIEYDNRLLKMNVNGTLYLDGLWQSENYFKDIAHVIRYDLHSFPVLDNYTSQIFREINKRNAVALHMRWFDKPDSQTTHNVSLDYYQRAIALMEHNVDSPYYFLFSDEPNAAQEKLKLPKGQVTVISHYNKDNNSYTDLWLMSQCRHYITANSTFSWWGAWLGEAKEKIILTPKLRLEGKAAWGFKGLIPDGWIEL